MAKFEFRSRDLELDVAGNVFTIEVGPTLGDKMKAHSDSAYELADEIKNGTKRDSDATEYCLGVIDELFGTGASDKIFAERDASLGDCLDILYFVTDEVSKHNARSGNRAQRRAAGKKQG